MLEPGAEGAERATIHVLLASARDWFVSALRAVLEPEGFTFTHVRSGEIAVRDASLVGPELVIIDEGLPDASAAELCRRLAGSALGRSVPILVYSPNFWHESQQAEAMAAGAWDIIREPIRSTLLVAKLDRLLQIKRLIETAETGGLAGTQAGVFNLADLMRTLPILGSLAARADAALCCAVLGPTAQAPPGPERERRRRRTAEVCLRHTRTSDVCAWMGDSDVVLVVYGANVADTRAIVRRLADKAPEFEESPADSVPLSAGIVELSPAHFVPSREGVEGVGGEGESAGEGGLANQIASLSRFAAAQHALQQARETGGGIRIAEVV
ncbi:MAG: response regulator transcription factor [Gemmatimonadota bacterium]